MKTFYLMILRISLTAIVFVISCKKSSTPLDPADSKVSKAEIPVRLNFNCSLSPDYGDSIIYPKQLKTDYIIFPVNRGLLGQGVYMAWPSGLLIDSVTGAINISHSETGLRYIVGFVKAGTKDTCLKNLVVAGITYADSIYVLSSNDTLAIPYYNADATAPAVCNQSDDDDYPDHNGHGHGDDRCVFDGTDKKGKKGQANAQNVKVRTISGVINLKATLAAGAFGSNPVNGTTITTTIAYSLDDKSKKAIQQISVQLMYFNKKSDIPAALVSRIAENNSAFFQNLPILKSPRPPIIVVTRLAL